MSKYNVPTPYLNIRCTAELEVIIDPSCSTTIVETDESVILESNERRTIIRAESTSESADYGSRPGRGVSVGGNISGSQIVTGDNNRVTGPQTSERCVRMKITMPPNMEIVCSNPKSIEIN